jgi:hypothetical protein
MNTDEKMTFKQFTQWCDDRACDGHWDMLTAMVCIDLHDRVMLIPFWKREKTWKNKYMNQVLNEIVNPINKKIAEIRAAVEKR